MYKIPVSVLVLIHTPDLQVLLMERASRPGFWQSVTGSRHEGEPLFETAVREVGEETGIDARAYPLTDWNIDNRFEIFPEGRYRYPPGTTHNTEHVFGLLLPTPMPVKLAPHEHVASMWLPWEEAARATPSWSNAAAIRLLPERSRSR